MNALKKYINVKETRDARLGFEACRLLGSLFCHKKYTFEWVYSGSHCIYTLVLSSVSDPNPFFSAYMLDMDPGSQNHGKFMKKNNQNRTLIISS